MTTMTYALADSATMLRRNLRHMLRYPTVTLTVMSVPIVFLLLFVFVFGGTLGAGLAGGAGKSAYANYVVPGVLLLAIAGSAQGTAISMAMDMTEGIIARFRSMSIARASVLTGHVVGSTIQTILGVIVVVAVSFLVGFRPTATPIEWLAAFGMFTLISFAMSWLCVAMGLATKTVESASNLPMPLMLLPFLGSGFVPADSMSAGLRAFATYQPFTPMIETFRGLLLGTAIGHSAVLAIGWCVVMGGGGYLWARRAYNRRPAR
jgi:ABC-2 type transport system permease protein